MNRQAAQAADPAGPTVTIGAPLPLPVTGSVAVTGNVGIIGTPNVSVMGTPNVRVANTLTAPALTLDISKSASQHVGLLCSQLNPPNTTCFLNGTTAPYVVPAGQNLMVTSVDIKGYGGGGIVQLITQLIEMWVVPNDGFMHSFQYPSGVVYPGGFVFNSPNIFSSGEFNYGYLQGYLTPI